MGRKILLQLWYLEFPWLSRERAVRASTDCEKERRPMSLSRDLEMPSFASKSLSRDFEMVFFRLDIWILSDKTSRDLDMLLSRSRLCLARTLDSCLCRDAGGTGGMEETGEVSVEIEPVKEGECLRGELGWKGGRPMSLLGVVTSGGTADRGVMGAGVKGVTGAGVMGVPGAEGAGGGAEESVQERLSVVGRVGLFTSFFIQE